MLKRCREKCRKHNWDVELFYGMAEKLPFIDNAFDKDRPAKISDTIDLVPPHMLNVNVKTIADGDLYCLSFRKP